MARWAAAAAVLVLLGTWLLLRPAEAPDTVLAGDQRPRGSDIRATLPGGDSIVARNSYSVPTSPEEKDPGLESASPVLPQRTVDLVASRPSAEGLIVRTADRPSDVEIIGDDALLEAVPGLALARIGDPRGPYKVFVRGPGIERVVHVN